MESHHDRNYSQDLCLVSHYKALQLPSTEVRMPQLYVFGQMKCWRHVRGWLKNQQEMLVEQMCSRQEIIWKMTRMKAFLIFKMTKCI